MSSEVRTEVGSGGVVGRILESGMLRYAVGFEGLLVLVAVLALQLMNTGPMQGVIVGMAISLIILSVAVMVVAVAAAVVRGRLG